jgi:hypothetical protein
VFNANDLLALLDARPFVPFRFVMNDGTEVAVKSRRLVMPGRQCALNTPDWRVGLMSDNWYYAKNGQRFGPFRFDQIRQLAASGVLHANDMLMNEAAGQWVSAQAVAGLFTALGVPPVSTSDASAAPEAPAPRTEPFEAARSVPPQTPRRLGRGSSSVPWESRRSFRYPSGGLMKALASRSWSRPGSSGSS